MKRKLTNAQMQDSVAELTDDVTELKEKIRAVRQTQKTHDESLHDIFQALEITNQALQRIALHQEQYEKRSDKRLTRLETTVQRLSDTVDRYLSARLNGSSRN